MERQEFIGLKKFPEVRVIKKLLDPKWAAQYREKSRPPRIELGVVLLGFTREQRRTAIVHEIGHWLRCEHLPRPKGGRKGEEEFAEAFTAYMLTPQSFRRSNPMAHKEFDCILKGGKKAKLNAFANRILKEMDKLV